mmetsp:Transcript_150407/g.483382  ORF Transcript_150407/g.483382 Transcript_150407/m.483382 type:complete len:376 (-) Transcript_150407:213-1340(-)
MFLQAQDDFFDRQNAVAVPVQATVCILNRRRVLPVLRQLLGDDPKHEALELALLDVAAHVLQQSQHPALGKSRLRHLDPGMSQGMRSRYSEAWIQLHELLDQVPGRRRQLVPHSILQLDRLTRHLLDQLSSVSRLERSPAGQHVVEDNAEGPHVVFLGTSGYAAVAPHVDVRGRQLRGHRVLLHLQILAVVLKAEEIRSQDEDLTHIANLDLRVATIFVLFLLVLFISEDQGAGRKSSMCNSLGMRHRQRHGCLPHVVRSFLLGQRAFGRNMLEQCQRIRPLVDEEERILVLERFDEPTDMGMLQVAQQIQMPAHCSHILARHVDSLDLSADVLSRIIGTRDQVHLGILPYGAFLFISQLVLLETPNLHGVPGAL